MLCQARRLSKSANLSAFTSTISKMSERRVNPSAERNREPILSVLRSALDLARPLRCLEIASGSGTHVGHFAEQLPEVQWQPSDCDPANMDSLCAYQQASSHGNIRDPLVIDISKTVELEPGFEPDLLLCINMIHISPWACTLGLMANAGKAEQLKYLQPSLFVVGQLLREGGKLITYGPYSVNGVLEPESNRQFDQNLKVSSCLLVSWNKIKSFQPH